MFIKASQDKKRIGQTESCRHFEHDAKSKNFDRHGNLQRKDQSQRLIGDSQGSFSHGCLNTSGPASHPAKISSTEPA
jgi:hypothetical protein